MSRRLRHNLQLFNRTSAPTAPESGDIWYRSDTDQFRGSDGLAGEPLTIGPEGNLPVIRPSAWHGLPAYGSNATANVPVNRMFALPFWPGRTSTLTALAGNVTLALVGGNLRMGLYASDGVLPTTLIADYGTVTAGLTGFRSITGLSTQIRPVLHYLIIGRQGGVLNLGLMTKATWDPIVSELTPSGTANLNCYYKDPVAGGLPANFGTPDGLDTAPALWVQLT
ncbi:hypothetical protein [Streptomyces sp. NPDC002122]|uniref:hypothetical protein n=1 Tax=Streptomyces sp. NPDC002122 TaxID=3154407 RepID=UPI0033201734